jgi:hypothetical protein
VLIRDIIFKKVKESFFVFFLGRRSNFFFFALFAVAQLEKPLSFESITVFQILYGRVFMEEE